MKTIALVTQKGGAGKSTLASSLAVAAFEGGERVCLIDMDPQATLTTWRKTRGETDIPVNPCKAKRLTNMRSTGDGKGIQLDPPLRLSLERALEYIATDG